MEMKRKNDDTAKSMKVLLVEDEVVHCEKYVKCAENLPYEVKLDIAYGFKKAVNFTEDNFYDAILLDLEYNEGDGSGISFLRRIKEEKQKKASLIIIITNNCSPSTHNIVRGLGADYIVLKSKPDYSPRMIFELVNDCVNGLTVETEQKSLDARITCEVEKIGFAHDVIGTKYLINAIAVIIYAGKTTVSLAKDVYPVLAKRYNRSEWSICRAIQTAIDRTWRITDPEVLKTNYTANIDNNLGAPSNKQIIFYILEKFKDEINEKNIGA